MSLVTVTYNRPYLFKNYVLPSVLAQKENNFEWIVVNDGRNSKTREIINNLNVPFPLRYIEMEHIEDGFSLCEGKNLALKAAQSEIIGYIDDDNRLFPSYTQDIVKAFVETNCSFLMSQQNRYKKIIINNETVKEEGPVLSPSNGCSIRDLVIPNKRSYFDSNGFAHLLSGAPLWDKDYRIFCDYSYLIMAIESWGEDSFYFLEKELVDYIQTSRGVIGSSKYSQWADEFKMIWKNPNLKKVCNLFDGESWFPHFISYFEKKALASD